MTVDIISTDELEFEYALRNIFYQLELQHYFYFVDQQN